MMLAYSGAELMTEGAPEFTPLARSYDPPSRSTDMASALVTAFTLPLDGSFSPSSDLNMGGLWSLCSMIYWQVIFPFIATLMNN